MRARGEANASARTGAHPADDRPARPGRVVRRRGFAATLPALLLAAIATPALAQERPMHHATGPFEVKITPEAQSPAPDGGQPVARMAIAKTFTGGLTGTATGTMLAAGTPGPGRAAAYVAVDQFHGTVDGRAGGFVLLHRGTVARDGTADLQVTIAPDSGTGALAGIAGTLTITQSAGQHRYDLAYTLPAG